MRELLLFVGGEQVEVARHPHAYLCVHEFLVLQSRLLKEQLQHGLALLLNLFLAHIAFYDYGDKGNHFLRYILQNPLLFSVFWHTGTLNAQKGRAKMGEQASPSVADRSSCSVTNVA